MTFHISVGWAITVHYRARVPLFRPGEAGYEIKSMTCRDLWQLPAVFVAGVVCVSVFGYAFANPLGRLEVTVRKFVA